MMQAVNEHEHSAKQPRLPNRASWRRAVPRGRPRDLGQDLEAIRVLALVHRASDGAVCLNASQLADWLRRSKTSVLLRLAHLEREGLVAHDGRRGYLPTAAGLAMLPELQLDHDKVPS